MWNICIVVFLLSVCGVLIYGAFFKKVEEQTITETDDYDPYHGGVEDESILN